MIIYHIGHFGALSKALLIHLNYHKDRRCVFLIDTFLCNHETKNFLQELSDRVKDFAAVVLYSDGEFANEPGKEELKKHLIEFFTALLQENGIDLQQAEKIYTMFDTYNAFGIYALIEHIPLTFVDIAGVMGKDRYKARGEEWKYYDELLAEYGALGYGCRNENCDFIYRDDALQVPQEGKISFNVLKNNLSKGEEEFLLSIYSFSAAKSVQKLCNLVVFSSGWIIANKKMDRREYYYYYQLALDFFAQAGNGILLKPHPNTWIAQADAEKYFDNCVVLPSYFPSEFISLLRDYQIQQVISTSLSGVPEGIYGCRYFTAFEIFYEDSVFKRLYFALQVEKFLQPKYKKFFHYGIHNKFAWGMQDGVFSKYKLHSSWASLQDFEPDSITIIDNYLWNGPSGQEKLAEALRKLDNNAVVIFLDSKDEETYLLKEYQEMIYYIRSIRFVKESAEKHADKLVEKIHIFCKDTKIFDLLDKFQYREYFQNSKNLYYSI